MTKTRMALNALKPFFDVRIRDLDDVICAIVGCLAIGIVVFRAYSMDLTHDEAYTYLNTGRIQDFWKMYQFRIANTHVLNSLLMVVSTLLFPYSDLAIRFPNILMSVVYVCISFSLSRYYRNRLLIVGLLTLFHFMLEFMAQGRGYGMSATFILAAFFVHRSKDKFKAQHLWITFLLILAFYANYVAIAPAIALAAYYFFFDLERKLPKIPKKTKRWIVALVAIGLYGFFSVTLKGKPLFGAYKAGFFEAIPLEYLQLFFPHLNFSLLVVTSTTIVFVLLVALLVILKKPLPYSIIAIITFSLIALMAFAGDKPLPTGRVLLPFWPVVVLAVMELVEKVSLKLKVPTFAIRTTNVVLIGLLVFNVVGQIDGQNLIASKKEQWKFPLKALAKYGDDYVEPQELYYIQKDNRQGIIADKISSMRYEHVANKEVPVRVYQDLDLIRIDLPIWSEDQQIYREVSMTNGELYRDTLQLNDEDMLYQKTEHGARLFMPYPIGEVERLSISSSKGEWKQSFHLGGH